MIVKFLQSKKSKGSGAVSYLLSEKKHLGSKPEILKGDEKLTRAIIKNNHFSQKATFGVLSFEEKNIDQDLKYKLMADFEKVLMPNMDTDNYNILWVEHLDKGRLELNFVIPKIELSSRKSFNPFWDKFDRNRINTWREIQNLKYGFSSPEDLTKKNTISQENEQDDNKKLTPNQIKNKKLKKLEQSILDNLHLFENRNDLISFAAKSVHRIEAKKNYLAVYFDEKQTKASRLKGLYANEKFRTIDDIRELITEERARIDKQKRERTGEGRTATLGKLEEKLFESINKKKSQISKLFPNINNLDNYNDNLSQTEISPSISELLSQARREQTAINSDREREKESNIRAIKNKADASRNKIIEARISNERIKINAAKREHISNKKSKRIRANIRTNDSDIEGKGANLRIREEIKTRVREIHASKKGIIDDYITRAGEDYTRSREKSIRELQSKHTRYIERVQNQFEEYRPKLQTRIKRSREDYKRAEHTISENERRTGREIIKREEEARGRINAYFDYFKSAIRGATEAIQDFTRELQVKIKEKKRQKSGNSMSR